MTTVAPVAIIGSGPAAHTAALYLARANLSPILFEGDSLGDGGVVSGGLLTTTKTVENFPGFPDGIEGMDLTDRFRAQSLRFGTIIRSETVTRITRSGCDSSSSDDGPVTFQIHTATATEPTTVRAVIIATGSVPQRLDVPGFDKYWNNGISTCAVCDGSLPCYRGVPIAVVGGGDSACEEALHLSHTASVVYLIHRRDTLRASKIMAARVLANSKIVPVWESEIREIHGSGIGSDSDRIASVTLINTKTGEESELAVKGLFVAIGHKPATGFVADLADLALDETGYIRTDRRQATSIPGIWAAGDVQDPHYRQAIVAAGSGCVAALEAERWLSL